MREFISKKKEVERILVEDFPWMLDDTIHFLSQLNTTIERAYEDHSYTFWMMNYILRYLTAICHVSKPNETVHNCIQYDSDITATDIKMITVKISSPNCIITF